MAMPAANRPKGRSIRNLRMVWSFALRYPGHIAVAAIALLVAAAATSGVPYAFKLIIDKGFAHGAGTTHDIARWFEYLLLLVGVLALGDSGPLLLRVLVGRGPSPTSALRYTATCFACRPASSRKIVRPKLLRGSQSTRQIIEQVVGTTVSVALRNAILGVACIVILFALAPRLAASILIGSIVVVLPASSSAVECVRSRFAARTELPMSGPSQARSWAP